MTLIDNPLTWPLFPCLPVVRIGRGPAFSPDDLGLVGAGAGLVVVPVVFVVNVGDVAGRSFRDLFDNVTIRRETYASVEALAREWQPD